MTMLLIIAWLVTGYASAVYWWTKDNNLHVGDACFLLIFSPFGPIWFFIGWCFHGDRSDKPLIKQRGAGK